MAPVRTTARAYGGTLAVSMNEVVSQIFLSDFQQVTVIAFKGRSVRIARRPHEQPRRPNRQRVARP